MKEISELLPALDVLIRGLGKHFGESVEFVVHDYKKDFARTIVAISNGNVTKREVGDSGTSIGLKSCMVRRRMRVSLGISPRQGWALFKIQYHIY